MCSAKASSKAALPYQRGAVLGDSRGGVLNVDKICIIKTLRIALSLVVG
jgi:hypothetical protein